MKTSPTQWHTPEEIGLPQEQLDAMHNAGELMRRRTTEDGGDTWIVRYKGVKV